MVQTSLGAFLDDKCDYISHRNIKNGTICIKEYQVKIAKNCLLKNTAVILPTGLGKTIIAFLVIAEILPKKVLILAPTKPLVVQHYESALRFLDIDEKKIAMFSGTVAPKKRKEIFSDATIIVSTPQTVENDLKKGLYNLDDIGLVVFDEMHKAVENYAYVGVAARYDGLILGLTASPSSKRKKIAKIFDNLKIENIESRTRQDSDVKDYIKKVDIEWLKIDMDEEQRKIHSLLYELYKEKVEGLNKVGILSYKKAEQISVTDILGARLAIRRRFGRKPYVFALYVNLNVMLHAHHSIGLIESQGTHAFLKYAEKFGSDIKRSEKMFLNDERIKEAISLARKHNVSHPKLDVLRGMIVEQFNEENDSLVIIFVQYRNTIESIMNCLKDLPFIKMHYFIGQAKNGMNQAEQKEIIDKFKKRKINTLIATSIAEEGIDIPNVNKVIFYEPIASEIRAIQRKGRTGRSHIGKVAILIAKGTRDEAFFYAGMYKEKKMNNLIYQMKNEV